MSPHSHPTRSEREKWRREAKRAMESECPFASHRFHRRDAPSEWGDAPVSPSEWRRRARQMARDHWRREMGHHRRHHPRGSGSLLFKGLLGLSFVALLVAGGIRALTSLIRLLSGGKVDSATPAIWIAAGALAVCVFLIGLVGKRVYDALLLPMADIIEAAQRAGEGDLSVRVCEQGHGEIRRLARGFNQMITELETAEQRRRDLTADIAHDLRTPLHIIQGNLEGIIDGVYQPTAEHLEATLDETRRLSRLIEDLRTLSLAEAQQLMLRLEAFDVGDLLADMATSFAGPAESAGVELVCSGQDLIGLTLRGDYDRLAQILGNLLANALRFTPPGGQITLSGRADDEQVTLSVRDTGCGIAPDDLPHVFDRLWRGDDTRSQRDGSGSGLGLPIARQLALSHGGDIRVESELGVGSTFWLTLPRAPQGDA